MIKTRNAPIGDSLRSRRLISDSKPDFFVACFTGHFIQRETTKAPATIKKKG
jgi:hypothetical protein